MDIAGHNLFTGPGLSGDQDRGVGGCNLVGQLDHPLGCGIAVNDAGAFFGNGFQNRSNQFRIRRQGNVFLGPGADGGSGGLRVSTVHAAGNDGRIDPLRQQGLTQALYIQAHVDQDDISPFAIA